MLYVLDSIMRYKVLYISAFLAFFLLGSGYSQKLNLILLPSSDTELKLYDIEAETTETTKTSSGGSYTNDVNIITPDISGNRKSSIKKDHRLCRMIGLVCKKEWSAGLIKLFKLPTTADIRIY